MTPTAIARYVAAIAVAAGGYQHFDLYRHSYHAIDRIGPLFALNVIVSAGLTAALLTRTDRTTRYTTIAFTASTLLAFVVSRTVGLLGFKETGLNPSPQAAITLAAETIALLALLVAPRSAHGRVHARVGGRDRTDHTES